MKELHNIIIDDPMNAKHTPEELNRLKQEWYEAITKKMFVSPTKNTGSDTALMKKLSELHGMNRRQRRAYESKARKQK